MIKEYSNISRVFMALMDVVILFGAFYAAYVWRSRFGSIGPIGRYLSLFYLSAPLTLAVFFSQGLYGPMRFFTIGKTVFTTLKALVMVGVISAAYLYLSHASYFSRLLFGYYFVFSSILLVAEKTAIKSLQNSRWKKGKGLRNIVIVGAGEKLKHLEDSIKNTPEWGLKVLSVIPFGEGAAEKTRAILENAAVDEVHIAFSRSEKNCPEIGPFLSMIEEYGKVIRVFINLDEELRFSKVEFFQLGDLPGLIFFSKPFDPDLLMIKRALDIIGATIGLMFTAFLFPFIALAIKLDSPGPVFFGQERVGLNGRRFKLYKFRSMYVDAEERKKELLASNELNGPIFKLSSDPRVTRVGRFLRITSLDELPQFWNVLKGDMALVGTRPPTPDEVEQYNAWHYRRISIRPGITGLWQVSGRNKIKDFDKIVALDIKYISEWSLWLDLKILLKTMLVVLIPTRSGAY